MRCVVHFYHREFESCKVADMHLEKMAKKFIGTKFVKLEAEKAPFFVKKLNVQTLPTMVCFVDGKAIWKQFGFMGVREYH
jgi:thioredoxin-like negative regulator of GroEL